MLRIIFSGDVPPEADYISLCEQLARWEAESVLAYETCEARVPGSFDGAPDS